MPEQWRVIEDIAGYLQKTGLINEIKLSKAETLKRLTGLDPSATVIVPKSPFTKAYMNQALDMQVRLPAEYESIESVFVSFPILYPSQWKTHMAIISAISKEAAAVVLVPDVFWHKAVILYLQQNNLDMKNIRFAYVKTDDVWTRDYGPTNVTVNGSVIVPIFGTKEDNAALELYKKAMPGYKVVAVNMSNYPVGSVHCQTNEMYR